MFFDYVPNSLQNYWLWHIGVVVNAPFTWRQTECCFSAFLNRQLPQPYFVHWESASGLGDLQIWRPLKFLVWRSLWNTFYMLPVSKTLYSFTEWIGKWAEILKIFYFRHFATKSKLNLKCTGQKNGTRTEFAENMNNFDFLLMFVDPCIIV